MVGAAEKPATTASVEAIAKGFSVPPEWELIVATLNKRKGDLKDRLAQW